MSGAFDVRRRTDNVTHRANGLDPARRSRMSRPLKTPESVIERFSAALQAGKVDELIELFEPDAVLLPATGAGSITGSPGSGRPSPGSPPCGPL
jgi:hypothetical protein